MAKKKVAKKAGKEMLLVGSKVKAAVKAKKMLCSSELLPALNEKVYALIADAAARTKANRRSTVKAQDV